MPIKNDALPVLQSKDERRKFYNKIAGVYDLLAQSFGESYGVLKYGG